MLVGALQLTIAVLLATRTAASSTAAPSAGNCTNQLCTDACVAFKTEYDPTQPGGPGGCYPAYWQQNLSISCQQPPCAKVAPAACASGCKCDFTSIADPGPNQWKCTGHNFTQPSGPPSPPAPPTPPPPSAGNCTNQLCTDACVAFKTEYDPGPGGCYPAYWQQNLSISCQQPPCAKVAPAACASGCKCDFTSIADPGPNQWKCTGHNFITFTPCVLVLDGAATVDAEEKKSNTLWYILGGLGGGVVLIGVIVGVVVSRKKGRSVADYQDSLIENEHDTESSFSVQ